MQIAFYLKPVQALILAALVTLSGCSQKIQNIGNTLHVATMGYKDVALSQEQIKALPYAAIQLKWGPGPRVLSVLAFAEGEDLKWVTHDKAMVVTRHGRLIKTLGFEHNVIYTANLAADPLPRLLQLWQQQNQQALRWGTERDYQPGYFSGYKALSRFVYRGQEQVNILGKPQTLVRFSELVSYPKLSVTQENTFWLSPNTGEVIKSLQFIGPGLPAVEITLLKPYQP